MTKLIIISNPNLSLKHAFGNHFSFYDPGRVTKNDSAIISIRLPNQEVSEYLQKHALILHVQKLYQVHLINSTRHEYLGLVQFDPVVMFFYSK